MTVNDFVKDQYYHCALSEEPDQICIIKFDKVLDNNRIHGYGVNNMNGYWSYSKYNLWVTNKSCRLATQQEINHLQACIKAGKYVECPKEEIINSNDLKLVDSEIINSYELY